MIAGRANKRGGQYHTIGGGDSQWTETSPMQLDQMNKSGPLLPLFCVGGSMPGVYEMMV
jgi:hypothetical protein